MLSRSVNTYSAPSAPLAGTSRLRRMPAYTRCLRCAGAPRRPTSGSGLSLTILSWHAALYDPGEFEHHRPSFDATTWPSPRSERLGTPIDPAIRFTRGTYFGASWFTCATACQVARPPLTDRTGSPQPQRAFTSRLPARSVTLPAAGYHYNRSWTPLLAGLTPARMAASLAAPDPDVQISRIRLFGSRLRLRGSSVHDTRRRERVALQQT